jgi:carboxymethylenebutenolidase
MIEKEISIQTPDGVADGYLIQPEKEGRWPGVLYLTDIGGIRDANRGMARRVAAEGYTVLLPNVFYRSGKPPLFRGEFKIGDEAFMKRVNELSQALPTDAKDRDLAAYVDFLAKQSSVSGNAFGVVGFCFTGPMALRTAAVRPNQIAAAASFHGGGLYTDAPTSPHTFLPRVKARLYFGHATDDRSMPKEAIEKLDRALTAWGGQYESEVYEGAHHGWTVPDNPAYNEPQAERAFTSLTTLFAETLKP